MSFHGPTSSVLFLAAALLSSSFPSPFADYNTSAIATFIGIIRLLRGLKNGSATKPTLTRRQPEWPETDLHRLLSRTRTPSLKFGEHEMGNPTRIIRDRGSGPSTFKHENRPVPPTAGNTATGKKRFPI